MYIIYNQQISAVHCVVSMIWHVSTFISKHFCISKISKHYWLARCKLYATFIVSRCLCMCLSVRPQL